MIEYYLPGSSNGVSYTILEQCLNGILHSIKPLENDHVKRLCTIDELSNSIHSIVTLQGAIVKPFGSFVSNLYSKWGDLDISIELSSVLHRKCKQNALREIRRALQIKGVARCTEFIPNARVPVLKYVSNRSGVACDISINNHPGRIKSKILYWVTGLDERFGDMVLLIKEWAKAQNINDPKTGTLNSYSLCLLVLFHFQTCEPAILPPLLELFDGNIVTDIGEMIFYDEKHIVDVCAANIARFKSQNSRPRNRSSLCHLLVSFFDKFSGIHALSDYAICTYAGQWKRIQENPSWMKKSYSMLVEDPFERPGNAARAVDMKGLERICSAIDSAHQRLSAASALMDRNTLLSLLCRPSVCSQLGGRTVAAPKPNTTQRSHQQVRTAGHSAFNPVRKHSGTIGHAVARPVHNHQPVETIGHPVARPFQIRQWRRVGDTVEPRTVGYAVSAFALREPVHVQTHNGRRLDSQPHSSSSSTASQRRIAARGR